MTARPANAMRTRFDIGDIVRTHRGALDAAHPLGHAQRRVLTDMAQCRTAALGGHVDLCVECGFEQPAYNSCRNRHCPKCQALPQENWIAKRREIMLDIGHFHIVFTLPSQLRPLAKFAPELVYNTLISAAAETLRELAADNRRVKLGITMVLHTWTRALEFHPHVHALVTAGGLADDGTNWVHCRGKYLFSIKVMGKLLRGKVMAALRNAHAEGRFAGFQAFLDPLGFELLMIKIAKLDWNVYAKAPFKKSQHVLDYLGRYTHRVGIANSRLLAVSRDAVTFRTKGDGVLTLAPIEFLRRFVQHVLPDRFHKIRHYGLYAGGAGAILLVARKLVGGLASAGARPRTFIELLLALTGVDISSCPQCRADLLHRPLPERARDRHPFQHARAPPVSEVA